MSVRNSLLAILARDGAHGYGLKSAFEEDTAGAWPLNVGQVYTTLARLERDGLVRTAGGDASRQRWRITAAGRRALQDWYAAPVEDDPPARDELAIKVMLSVAAGDAPVAGILQTQREATMERVQRLTRQKREADPDAELAWVLLIDLLLLRAKAELDWLELCEQRLAARGRVSAAAPLLRLEAVVRVYGAGPTAVRALGPVSLSVERGELVAVMGPSGSGKSTLLSLAGALEAPSSGRVVVDGRDLAALAAAELARLRRATVGYVFQELNLLPGLTALENVALPLGLDGARRAEARAAAAAALERLGLAALAARFPDDLSGGEQQRVAVARAVVGPRELVLADEPTGALDTVAGEQVARLLRAQCEAGRGVVLVTHDATLAGWADRILHLRDGALAGETPPARFVAGGRRA